MKNNLIVSTPLPKESNLQKHPQLYIFSVLQGLKARNFIHSKIEQNIKKKLQDSEKEPKHRDALQQLIDSSSRNGEQLSMQVLDRGSFPACENEFLCP